MGKNKTKEQQQTNQQGMQQVAQQAAQRYPSTLQPSELEGEMAPLSHNFADLYNLSAGRQMQDYGDTMAGYDQFMSGLSPDDYDRVSYERPEELGKAFGYLDEAMPGYRDFAQTGGYSNQDIQELRARGMSPIRSAYGNTMMELNRARALGGSGGAPNYIAAVSRAQREMPQQMADAMTSVNAELARDVREGKKFGLQGITGTGQTMGGLSDAEANRIMHAQTANQAARLQARGLYNQGMLGGLGGKTSLYGTTPGMTSMFGNQVLGAYGQRLDAEQARNQYGLGLLNSQLGAYGQSSQDLTANKGTPGWQTALGVAGTIAPYAYDYYKGRQGGTKPPGYSAPSAQQVNPNFNMGNVGTRVNTPSAPPTQFNPGSYKGVWGRAN